jgi:hypothetical protein
MEHLMSEPAVAADFHHVLDQILDRLVLAHFSLEARLLSLSSHRAVFKSIG